MITLKVGIASYEEMKSHAMRIARAGGAAGVGREGIARFYRDQAVRQGAVGRDSGPVARDRREGAVLAGRSLPPHWAEESQTRLRTRAGVWADARAHRAEVGV